MSNHLLVYLHYTQDTNELFYVWEGRPTRASPRANRNRHWRFKVAKHVGFRVEVVADGLTKSGAEALEAELIAKDREQRVTLVNFCKGTLFGTHWSIGQEAQAAPRPRRAEQVEAV